MAYEQKDGDIAVFKVKNKTKPNAPDWTGKALIDGVEKDISLWQKSDTMLAGTIKDKWKPDFNKAKEAAGGSNAPDDFEDSIPF